MHYNYDPRLAASVFVIFLFIGCILLWNTVSLCYLNSAKIRPNLGNSELDPFLDRLVHISVCNREIGDDIDTVPKRIRGAWLMKAVL